MSKNVEVATPQGDAESLKTSSQPGKGSVSVTTPADDPKNTKGSPPGPGASPLVTPQKD